MVYMGWYICQSLYESLHSIIATVHRLLYGMTFFRTLGRQIFKHSLEHTVIVHNKYQTKAETKRLAVCENHTTRSVNRFEIQTTRVFIFITILRSVITTVMCEEYRFTVVETNWMLFIWLFPESLLKTRVQLRISWGSNGAIAFRAPSIVSYS